MDFWYFSQEMSVNKQVIRERCQETSRGSIIELLGLHMLNNMAELCYNVFRSIVVFH